MSVAQISTRQVEENRAPHQRTALPGEAINVRAQTISAYQSKKVSGLSGKLLIYSAEGKKHLVKSTSQTIRILPKSTPDGGHYSLVQSLDGGVWDTVFTTPFGFDITVVPEDF